VVIDIGRRTEGQSGGEANASTVRVVQGTQHSFVCSAGLYPNIIVAPRPLINGTSKQGAREMDFMSHKKGEVYLQ